MKGKLNMRNWEESAAEQMGHCWMTDCESLYEHLMSQRLNSIENKRLAIDLMALRQQIWERSGDMKPTAESLMIKEKNRASRKNAKEQAKTTDD